MEIDFFLLRTYKQLNIFKKGCSSFINNYHRTFNTLIDSGISLQLITLLFVTETYVMS